MKTNKKGSSTVFMTMIIVTFMMMILISINISRRLVIKSQTESFGRVWSKAILSEYDIHLFEDYNLLAFKGNDQEISERLSLYLKYSFEGRMKSKIKDAKAHLSGYEMRDPNNFKRSIENSLKTETLDAIINGNSRVIRENNGSGEVSESDESGRKIGNILVLDTLPSRGVTSGPDVSKAIETLKQKDVFSKLKGKGIGTAAELMFIYKYLDSHLKTAEKGQTYFTNEWEYIIHGKPDDMANYTSCRRKIFMIRNGLNLASLKGDPTKMSILSAAAAAITPGPAALATEILLMELWAAAESEYDVQTLVQGGKVPVMKTGAVSYTHLTLPTILLV